MAGSAAPILRSVGTQQPAWRVSKTGLTAEGAVEEEGEEVLHLTQRLTLDCAQTFHAINQGGELLLQGKWGNRNIEIDIGARRFRRLR
jgi:hypothetical protein